MPASATLTHAYPSPPPVAEVPAQASVATLLADKVFLPGTTEELRVRYRSAKPFPHIIMDGLFSAECLKELIAEAPPVTAENFVQHHDDHQTKFGLRSAVSLGEQGHRFVAMLHSAEFLYLLSEMTGIWGLLPDPYLQGGGYHFIPRGGKFDVHLDRKTDYATGLRRQLAMVVYLNRGWRPEYGGALELWDPTGTRREVSVEPVFNRTILFEVGEKNYHGHPVPVACPEGNFRKSFMVYFHTVSEDGSTAVDMRSSVFAPGIYQRPQQRARKLAKDLVPPLLMRSMRSMRQKLK